jgi:uncharacterized delta-60 repeat protein
MKKNFLLIFFALSLVQLSAQVGTLDPSFGHNGYVRLKDSVNYPFDYTAWGPDGAMIGVITQDKLNIVYRFNSDGKFDRSFIIDSASFIYKPESFGFNGKRMPVGVAVDNAGRVIVAERIGEHGLGGGFVETITLTRFEHDGGLDLSFGSNGRIVIAQYSTPYYQVFGQMSVGNDGKIIVTLSELTYPWVNTRGYFLQVLSINSNGTINFSRKLFEQLQTPPIDAYPVVPNSLALQNDGKIVVEAIKSRPNAPDSTVLVRLDANGTPDPSFGQGGIVSTPSIGKTIAVQRDGKVVVGMNNNSLIRFNNDGTVDLTFGDRGLIIQPISINKLLVTQYEELLVGGSLHGDFALGRYAFGSQQMIITDFGGVEGIQNMALLFGALEELRVYGNGIWAFYPPGSTSFVRYPAQFIYHSFAFTAFTTDGRLVGITTEGALNKVYRYTTTGSLDTSFGVSTVAYNKIIGLAVDSLGKIIVAETEDTIFDGDYLMYSVARFNSNGTPDTSFGTLGINNTIGKRALFEFLFTSINPKPPISPLAVQNDNKIVATISRYENYESSLGVVRINTNGTNDFYKTLFHGFAYPPYLYFVYTKTIDIQDNEKIVIHGIKTFNSVVGGGGPSPDSTVLVRLNPDGTLDPSFGDGGITKSPLLTTTMAVQGDGSIMLVTLDNKLVRFTSGGAPDPTFGGTGSVQVPFSVNKLLVSKHKLIVGGSLNSDFAVARYNPEGTPDPTFGSGGLTISDFGDTEGIENMATASNRLYAYGSGILASYLLENDCTPPTFKNDATTVLDASCGNSDGQISIIPTSGTAPFMYSKDGGATYVSGPDNGYGFTNLAAGTYKLRLKDANGCESSIVERTVKTAYGLPTFVNNGLIILEATCANNDGNINIIPTSGTAPFTYSINGGTTYVTGPNAGYGFQNLPSGTYKLRLKDAKGCESEIIEREVKLNCTTTCTPPTFVNNGLIILDATCANNDGNINIMPTSGTAPFMYSINGGTTYVAGPNAGYGFQNLPSGTYKLRLKDAKGCESAIVERQVKLLCTTCTPPTFVNNGLIVLDASCGKSDGSINIIPTSGTAPFMYSINGGATYVAGPNAGYGFQNLPAGTYQLRLKDARGCESAIVERTVRNYYNCPNTVSTNTSETSLVLSNKDVVSTYPNPNNGQFKLLFQNFQSPKAEVLIYDAKGTLIQKRSLNLTQNTIADFDIKGKAAGLYLIKVVGTSEVKSLKVMIQ